MQKRRMATLAMLLLAALLTLTACGPMAGSGNRAATAGPNDLVVDLPAIYIDFDSQGLATIGGMRVSQAAALIGQELKDINVGPQLIRTLGKYNIQHVQLVNSQTGLDILVNGLRMPSLAWDSAILGNLKDLLLLAGVPLGSAADLLPLVGTFGTGIVLRFPVAEDKPLFPLVNPIGEENAARATAALAEVSDDTSMIPLEFVLRYAPDGTWTLDGRGPADWEEQLPMSLDFLTLDASTIESITEAGIRHIDFSSSEEGIQISVDDKAMPTITWASGEMYNIVTLLRDSGIFGSFADENPTMGILPSMIEDLIPAITAAEVTVPVYFPAP